MSKKVYSTEKEVMLALFQGTAKRKSMMELVYRWQTKKPEYSTLLKKGVDMYDQHLVDQQLKGFIDPEKELGKTAYEDRVGFKD